MKLSKLITGDASRESIVISGASLMLEFTTELEEIIPEIISDVNKLKNLSLKEKRDAIIDELLKLMDSILVKLNEEIEAFNESDLDELIWSTLRGRIKQFIKSSIEIGADGKLKKKKFSLFCCLK